MIVIDELLVVVPDDTTDIYTWAVRYVCPLVVFLINEYVPSLTFFIVSIVN